MFDPPRLTDEFPIMYVNIAFCCHQNKWWLGPVRRGKKSYIVPVRAHTTLASRRTHFFQFFIQHFSFRFFVSLYECLKRNENENPACLITPWEVQRLGMGSPGTGNIVPKTAVNREHQAQNSWEQGTFMKNSGTTEHWLKNSGEQGTLALKAPGTGNIGLRTAGRRKHSMKSSVRITNHP